MNNQPSSNIKCPAIIRIGTRKSRLAVAQATEVKNRLLGAFPELNQGQIEIIKMTTTGDEIQDRHLAEIGGKGLFTKEIEDALFDGSVDIAVHSMKDMPDKFPKGLSIDCILEREDPRDAFISRKYKSIADLPQGALVGTSSVRRQAQLLNIRPDLKIVQFRGNIITRLEKLYNGDVDATFLAAAGLHRVDKSSEITAYIEPEEMLPAVAQGAIGVECLSKNEHISRVIEHINHIPSNVRVQAERGFLKALGGSCSTPMAAYAQITKDGNIHLRCLLADIGGKVIHRTQRIGAQCDAHEMGLDAGAEILSRSSL